PVTRVCCVPAPAQTKGTSAARGHQVLTTSTRASSSSRVALPAAADNVVEGPSPSKLARKLKPLGHPYDKDASGAQVAPIAPKFSRTPAPRPSPIPDAKADRGVLVVSRTGAAEADAVAVGAEESADA